MNLIDRFLHYVSLDTQSDELTNMTPSTPGQMKFARELAGELKRIGLSEITLDDNGYLMATLPANTDKDVPVIGFIAHLDTSPEMSGHHVSPRIVKSYDGNDIVLNAEKNIVLRPAESPELLRSEVDKRIVKIRPMATPVDQLSRWSGARKAGSMIVDYYSVDVKPTKTTLLTA